MNDNYNLFAAIMSAYTICEIAELMPTYDLTEELKEIANIQYHVLHLIRENEEFDSCELDTYMRFLLDKLKEIDRLKNEKEKYIRKLSFEKN